MVAAPALTYTLSLWAEGNGFVAAFVCGVAYHYFRHSQEPEHEVLRSNSAVNLFILDRSAPTRYLEVRGDAELKEDTDYTFAERVGAKYQVDLRSFDGDRPGRVVVTIRPTRINAVNMLAES